MEHGDQNVVKVYMNSQDYIHVNPGESKTIYTDGFSGCNASTRITKHSDRSTTVVLDHYQVTSTHVDEHVAAINNSTYIVPRLSDYGNQDQGLVFTPGSTNGNIVPIFGDKAERIHNALRDSLGQDSSIAMIPYPMAAANEGHGGLIIKVSSDTYKPVKLDLHAIAYGEVHFEA